MGKSFSTVGEAVEALAGGRAIILLDAEDRENEGDLLVAAELITPHMIHFMLIEARGQLCMPVDVETADRVKLSPLVKDAELSLPRFTIPVDHRRCSTGVSPLDRSITIRQLASESSAPQDFIAPGHIFPLIARPGGLAERLGHTEAAIEFTRLAGLRSCAVLCEICSSDGLNMACRDELLEMSARFKLPITTIDAVVDELCITPANSKPAP
jgi:3,4-dihydroxy 2-butanone 4-phosphate synthase / GTP cyclohydrolase II